MREDAEANHTEPNVWAFIEEVECMGVVAIGHSKRNSLQSSDKEQHR